MDLWTLESYKLLKYITATIPMSNSKMHRNQQKLIKKIKLQFHKLGHYFRTVYILSYFLYFCIQLYMFEMKSLFI